MNITACEIKPATGVLANIMRDGGWGNPTVVVTYEDGTTEELFSYYSDEIRFTSGEFVGLTREQARDLHYRRDLAWLRS